MTFSDLWIGLSTAALGLAVYFYSRGFPRLPGGYPGPGLFPQVIAVLFVVFGVALALKAIRARVRPPRLDLGTLLWRREVSQALAVLAVIVLYILLVDRLGFVITAGLLMVGLMALLGVPWRQNLLVAILLVLLASSLFGRLLKIPLPPGPWGW